MMFARQPWHLSDAPTPIVPCSTSSPVVAGVSVVAVRTRLWMFASNDPLFCQARKHEPEVLHRGQSPKEQCRLLLPSFRHTHDI